MSKFIAIDWSGAIKQASKRIWLAEAKNGHLLRLENGRTRGEVTDHLISESCKDPDCIVGLDFAFSLPQWFLRKRRINSGPELWELTVREGAQWLADCCHPFWGRKGHPKPVLVEHFRVTEKDVSPVAGISAKSVFQINGAGAVGTGSIRGMPCLLKLRKAGFHIWPFDAPGLPLVIEINPPLLTGPVVKRRRQDREEYLLAKFTTLSSEHHNTAVSNEDAFDATVSALVMSQADDQLSKLACETNPIYRREGRIWSPGCRVEP